MKYRNLVLAIVLVGVFIASVPAQPERPLENAHAHNDYLHDRPLYDALDHGFTSVEVDIFLVDGELLVGHERETLQAGRTLESLYLLPLVRRVQRNGGRVHQKGQRFFLLVDIKSEPLETYMRLEKALSKHTDMITTIEDGEVQTRAVTVVITGNRPTAALSTETFRYAGLDGRLSDLESDAPAHLMPMISDRWGAHFSWNGIGPMPAGEKTKLEGIVRKAHAADRVVRFWATPDTESVWAELRSSGVDLINTDRLEALATFLQGSP